MGITKTAHYTEFQNEISLLLKAIGHPARLAILELLVRRKTCICGDIVDEIHLAQPTISQHLKALKEVGLIQGSIEGKSICYCINLEVFQQLVAYLNQMNEKIALNQSNACCS